VITFKHGRWYSTLTGCYYETVEIAKLEEDLHARKCRAGNATLESLPPAAAQAIADIFNPDSQRNTEQLFAPGAIEGAFGRFPHIAQSEINVSSVKVWLVTNGYSPTFNQFDVANALSDLEENQALQSAPRKRGR
jgi:hypothetical protein